MLAKIQEGKYSFLFKIFSVFVRPDEKPLKNVYKSNNKFKETFGIKGVDKLKSKLINLDFDFTSLHEFLGTSRHVMNQHASLLNSLREDIIKRWSDKEVANFFVGMSRSYPMDTIKTSMDQINRMNIAKMGVGETEKKKKQVKNFGKQNTIVEKIIPRPSNKGFGEYLKTSERTRSIPTGLSPRKSSPLRRMDGKEAVKASVEKFNSWVKHIADQLIFLSESIVKIQKANMRQDEELETKLYKREFESIFQAQSNKIISYVDPFIERYNEKLDGLSQGNFVVKSIIP